MHMSSISLSHLTYFLKCEIKREIIPSRHPSVKVTTPVFKRFILLPTDSYEIAIHNLRPLHLVQLQGISWSNTEYV